jgi:hypothetical protein
MLTLFVTIDYGYEHVLIPYYAEGQAGYCHTFGLAGNHLLLSYTSVSLETVTYPSPRFIPEKIFLFCARSDTTSPYVCHKLFS